MRSSLNLKIGKIANNFTPFSKEFEQLQEIFINLEKQDNGVSKEETKQEIPEEDEWINLDDWDEYKDIEQEDQHEELKEKSQDLLDILSSKNQDQPKKEIDSSAASIMKSMIFIKKKEIRGEIEIIPVVESQKVWIKKENRVSVKKKSKRKIDKMK